uniref:Secreted protein n=1 Tax=Steinernema glaseri TaxID=37863 RepID=A0A1I8AFW6_9BILA
MSQYLLVTWFLYFSWRCQQQLAQSLIRFQCNTSVCSGLTITLWNSVLYSTAKASLMKNTSVQIVCSNDGFKYYELTERYCWKDSPVHETEVEGPEMWLKMQFCTSGYSSFIDNSKRRGTP